VNFNWQFVDGGILNLGTEYALDISSTLLNFELDDFGRQRSFSQMLNDMLGKAKLIDFGTDLTYGQTINFNLKTTRGSPATPDVKPFVFTAPGRYKLTVQLRPGGGKFKGLDSRTITFDTTPKREDSAPK
jgi:hypothetical protein